MQQQFFSVKFHEILQFHIYSYIFSMIFNIFVAFPTTFYKHHSSMIIVDFTTSVSIF